MAVVHEARREGDETPLALKVLRRDLCRDPSLVRRFKRESRVLQYIEHPSIVPVLDSGHVDGEYYLVMPLIRLPTLRECLERPQVEAHGSGPGRPDLLPVLRSVLNALEAVHEVDVVHRDVTPGNIFVTSEGEGLLGDFGIVKVLGSESLLTRSGALTGTVPYMAPEQLSGEPVGYWTDLYQVGLLAYRLVAGRLPFEETLSDAVRIKCVASALPDPRRLGARAGPEIVDLIRRATSRAPSGRYGSAAEMRAALDAALQAPRT